MVNFDELTREQREAGVATLRMLGFTAEANDGFLGLYLQRMRLLVCGSRHWTNKGLIRAILGSLDSVEVVIHGGARGTDRLAGEVAVNQSVPVLEFPALWGRYGTAAGSIRNQQMLDEEKPTHVVAFHERAVDGGDIAGGGGTRDMIGRARKAGIPTVVYDSHGRAV